MRKSYRYQNFMKILLIEDDELLAKALKNGLEEKGYAVDAINDGAKGQRRFEIHHDSYDLAILDLMLPNVPGFEICKNIRDRKISTPILILTGKDDVKDKVHALNYGADDYLTKPFSTEELLARIGAIMRRPVQVIAGELAVGEVVLNPVTRKVYKNGKEIPLTLKEFGVLEYMMRHPNQVVLRDQILDHVWDFEFSSFSNIIDVHVNRLRKKMSIGKKGNILETVRGVGYRLRT